MFCISTKYLEADEFAPHRLSTGVHLVPEHLEGRGIVFSCTDIARCLNRHCNIRDSW